MTVADSPAYLGAPSVDGAYVAVKQAAQDALSGMTGQGMRVAVEGRRSMTAAEVATLAKNVLVEAQFERPTGVHHSIVVLADADDLTRLFALAPPAEGETIAAESLLSLGDIVSTFIDSVVGELAWLQPKPRAWLANMEPVELDATGVPHLELPATVAQDGPLYMVDVTLTADDDSSCPLHVVFGEGAEKAWLGLDEPEQAAEPRATDDDGADEAAPPDDAAPATLDEALAPAASRVPAAPEGGPANTPVQPARFKPLGPEQASNRGQSIDLIKDVPLHVSVELGRASLTVREILALGPGSVVQLDRLAGEPVDILVNDRLIAHGEVVIVDESFGVRITEIVRESGRRGAP